MLRMFVVAVLLLAFALAGTASAGRIVYTQTTSVDMSTAPAGNVFDLAAMLDCTPYGSNLVDYVLVRYEITSAAGGTYTSVKVVPSWSSAEADTMKAQFMPTTAVGGSTPTTTSIYVTAANTSRLYVIDNFGTGAANLPAMPPHLGVYYDEDHTSGTLTLTFIFVTR